MRRMLTSAPATGPTLNEPDDTPCPATRALMRSMTGPAPALPSTAGSVSVQTLAALGADGRVELDGPGASQTARTVVRLTPAMVGRQVLVIQEAGGPIVTGVIQDGSDASADAADAVAPADPAAAQALADAPPFELEVDGERVVVDARRQLVLRCGQASITLTREGKILLRGTYISSRASGVHRISGGSVELN